MKLAINMEKSSQMLLVSATKNAIQNVVPLNLAIDSPRILGQSLEIQFGVLIGMTGDMKGKLVLSGDSDVFGNIGEVMFGMKIGDEMLSSFSGELGNMIAGGLSSQIYENGLKTDITSPTVLSGNTTLSGFQRALHIPATFERAGEMGIYLLLDAFKGMR